MYCTLVCHLAPTKLQICIKMQPHNYYNLGDKDINYYSGFWSKHTSRPLFTNLKRGKVKPQLTMDY